MQPKMLAEPNDYTKMVAHHLKTFRPKQHAAAKKTGRWTAR